MTETNKLLLERVNNALPQTQCRKCGFNGCEPYALALTKGAAINKCPPGGDTTIKILSGILGKLPIPLDPDVEKMKPIEVAYIREADCIGCTKCINACPIDAIIGGAKLMHTIIKGECSGCDLCVDSCPVGCIEMQAEKIYHPLGCLSDSEFHEKQKQAMRWRKRYDNQNERLNILKQSAMKKTQKFDNDNFSREEARKEILAAVARMRTKRNMLKNFT